jgi:hypothetical protein
MPGLVSRIRKFFVAGDLLGRCAWQELARDRNRHHVFLYESDSRIRSDSDQCGVQNLLVHFLNPSRLFEFGSPDYPRPDNASFSHRRK